MPVLSNNFELVDVTLCLVRISDHVNVVNTQLSDWLRHASLNQAPNPYSKGFFRKDQQPPVTEVDGTPSREFFTALCIGERLLVLYIES